MFAFADAVYSKSDGAAGALVKILNEQDPSIRQQAALFLGGTEDSTAIGPLVERLGDESEHWYVAEEAARSLDMIGDKRAIEPLRRALKHLKGDVLEEAQKALEKIQRR